MFHVNLLECSGLTNKPPPFYRAEASGVLSWRLFGQVRTAQTNVGGRAGWFAIWTIFIFKILQYTSNGATWSVRLFFFVLRIRKSHARLLLPPLGQIWSPQSWQKRNSHIANYHIDIAGRDRSRILTCFIPWCLSGACVDCGSLL